MNSEFIEEGYVNSGLFVLDIVTPVSMNKIPSFAYIIGFVNMWHCCLGHVGVGSINHLRKMNLLRDVIDDGLYKCEVCAEAKFVRKHFKPVTNRVFKTITTNSH